MDHIQYLNGRLQGILGGFTRRNESFGIAVATDDDVDGVAVTLVEILGKWTSA